MRVYWPALLRLLHLKACTHKPRGSANTQRVTVRRLSQRTIGPYWKLHPKVLGLGTQGHSLGTVLRLGFSFLKLRRSEVP